MKFPEYPKDKFLPIGPHYELTKESMLEHTDHPLWPVLDQVAKETCALHQTTSPTSQPCAACTEQAWEIVFDAVRHKIEGC